MLRRVASAVPRRMVATRATNLHVRNFSISARTMSLKPLDYPVTATLPSDSFQLLPESQKAGAAEDELYEQQIKDVEAWWGSPRYEGIKRPYSAADVVSKRGSQLQSYPSSVMARKLFNLIKEREAKGEPIHTSTSINNIELPALTGYSGCNRSCTSDSTSTKPRGPIHIRVGMFISPHHHERSFS